MAKKIKQAYTKGRPRKYRNPVRMTISTEADKRDACIAAVNARAGNHDDLSSLVGEGIDMVLAKYNIVTTPSSKFEKSPAARPL